MAGASPGLGADGGSGGGGRGSSTSKQLEVQVILHLLVLHKELMVEWRPPNGGDGRWGGGATVAGSSNPET